MINYQIPLLVMTALLLALVPGCQQNSAPVQSSAQAAGVVPVKAAPAGPIIEHVAFNVKDARAAAQWYADNMNMKIIVAGGAPEYGHFLADSSGTRLLELYSNPNAPVLDFKSLHPSTLHLAFCVNDVAAVREKLLKAGATAEGEVNHTATGNDLAFVRDPWGLVIQLVHRAKPMI